MAFVLLCLFVLTALPALPAPKLRVVDLEGGTPYHMGLVHGRALKGEIRELVKRWKADLEKAYGLPADAFIAEFLRKTDFKPAISRWTPGLLDEVRGIADAAGVDFDTMYAYQLIDEFWAIGPDLGFPKCTTIAAGPRNGAPPVVAQTLDLPELYHGYQAVLRVRDEKLGVEALVFTVPGIVAANGLNDRSIGVCVNAVTQLAYSPAGLPVAFVIRGLLRQKTFDEAVAFLGAVQPAAPQTYVLGGPDEVAVLERSAGRISKYAPFEGAEFGYHTNHPMVNEDYNPKFPELLKSQGLTIEAYRARCRRFAALQRQFADNSAPTDLETLKGLFRDRNTGVNNAQTYGCTVMVLGDKPELHVTPGRPDLAAFQTLGFKSRR